MTNYSDNTLTNYQTPQFYTAQGLALAARGQVNSAIQAFKQAVKQDPEYADAYFNLALANADQGDIQAAIENYRCCLRLNPDHVASWYNLANTLLKIKYFNAAIEAYHRVIELNPQHALAFNNLGLVLIKSGKITEAIEHLKKAIALQTDFTEAHYNLGAAYLHLGDKAQGEAQFQTALDIDKRYSPAVFHLGNLYLEMNKPQKAISMFQQYLQYHPQHAAALNNLGNAYYRQGQVTAAVSCYKESIQFNPNNALTYFNLANALQASDKANEAISLYHKALTLEPRWPEACNNLGTAYQKQGLLGEAIVQFQKALELCSNYAEALNNLGIAFRHQGRIKAAISCYRAALQIKPEYNECHSNLLFGLNYDPNLGQKDLFQEASGWWNKHGLPIANRFAHHNTRDPNRRLKIGYVSADFCRHPVGFFFLPLALGHNHDNFEVSCYTDIIQPDELTDQISATADRWYPTTGLSDADLADKIHADQIDILIDLAGHSAHNRMRVFALKPAPLQVNWLGYVNTTGLASMDYRITDDIVDPEQEENRFHSETIIRLGNGFFCFLPPPKSPPVSDLPARRKGYITFGSFNNLAKINDEVLALWSQIMHRCHASRLRLMAKPLADASTRDHYLGLFQANGISPHRIETITYTPSYYDYLSQYSQIDIGLDTYPHNGHTTTCDCLWMGVPVITMCGDRYASRMGASILTRLQLEQFVTDTKEAYRLSAINLANNWDRLQELRLGMRKRFTSSPIHEANRFAGDMETALRGIWREWCRKN